MCERREIFISTNKIKKRRRIYGEFRNVPFVRRMKIEKKKENKIKLG